MEPNEKRKWFAIKSASDDTTDIMIYEDVGIWGVTAKDFIAELNAIATPKIAVRINTMGGEVFDGLAIYNSLKKCPKDVTVIVEGIASSVGSIIAMSGKKILMAPQSMMMIHMPWSYCQGNATAMRKEAAILDKIADEMVQIYTARTGLDSAKIKAFLEDETWMTAEECRANGFCDGLTDTADAGAVAVAAKRAFNFLGKRFAKFPDHFKAVLESLDKARQEAERAALDEQQRQEEEHKARVEKTQQLIKEFRAEQAASA